MRKYLIGGILGIIVLGLLSYTTSDDVKIGGGLQRLVYNIPIKQKKVVETRNIDYVNELVKKGYILEFVIGANSTIYILIKY